MITPRRLALATALVAAATAPSAASAGTATDEMRYCSQLGPKPPGSAAGRAEARRIAQRFRDAGLETRFENFNVPVYTPRKVSIAVVGQDGGPVPGESFAYGGTGSVEAEVVDVGMGRAEDYSGKDVKDKIVMVSRNEAFHRSSQLTEVIRHGGAAMLYVSGAPDNLIQTGSVRFAQQPPSPILTVTVGAEDGARLRERLERGALRMRTTVRAARQDGIGRNVIGVRRGTEHPDQVIVVGGHYDNWHQGAVDNCTAVGTMLAMADAVKDTPLPYTVVFGAWDAEEVGLTGSYDYVHRHRAELGNVLVNLNLEMTAAHPNAAALRFGTSSPAMNVVATAAAAANQYTAAPVPANGVRAISGGIIPTDLQPFYSAGVQGFSTFTSTPVYHTTEDLPQWVDELSLERVSRYATDALLGLQDVPPDALRLREVPTVTVTAPKRARPGAAVPVDIQVTGVAGEALTSMPVDVLVNQNDHWSVTSGRAEEVGGARYRYTIPAGATDADRTKVTVIVNRAEYRAEGYADVDQRRGGLLRPAAGTCSSRRVVRLKVRKVKGTGRIVRLRARTTAGKVRVVGRRLVVVDRRGTAGTAATVTLTARTSKGTILRQSRQLRSCAGKAAVARALEHH